MYREYAHTTLHRRDQTNMPIHAIYDIDNDIARGKIKSPHIGRHPQEAGGPDEP
jgi:hypothetical protein